MRYRILRREERGVATNKGGRPPHVPPIRPHLFRITDAQARLLRTWGRGDMAAGLRGLIDAAAPLIVRVPREGES